MKKLNEKGFGVVESLLAIIAITLVTGVSFYVVRTIQQDQKKEEPTQSNQQSEISVAETDTRKTYSVEALPFSFKYQAEWTTKVDEGTSEAYAVMLTAPGTKFRENSIGSTDVESGALITVQKMVKVDENEDLSDLKNRGMIAQYGSNKKDVSVDGRAGLEYDLAYEGPATHSVEFFDGQFHYGAYIQKDVYEKAEFKKAFDDLVASIKFKN